MIDYIFDWLSLVYHSFAGLFSRAPVRLAIVRRYQDANGNYIGELYMEREHKGISGYDMIGVSLDSMPLGVAGNETMIDWTLDTRNDFLVPLTIGNVVRVGAQEPKDNDNVRRMIARLPRKRMSLIVQNRFIEYVLDKKI